MLHFMVNLIFGIPARSSVRRMEFGRILGEQTILKKDAQRLSAYFVRKRLGDTIQRWLLEINLHKNALTVLELSDMAEKSVGEAMPQVRFWDDREIKLSNLDWGLPAIRARSKGAQFGPG